MSTPVRTTLRSMLTIGFAILFLLHGGGSAEEGPDVRQLVQAGSEFTFHLYRQAATERQGNLVLSGHSVLNALLLAAPGARGTSAQQLGEVLQLPQTARRQQPDEPWDFQSTIEQLTTLEQEMSPGDPAATAAKREELTELEARLNAARTPEDDFELSDEASQVATQIDRLRQQIDPYELRLANSLWVDAGFPLRSSYLASLRAGAAVFPSRFQQQPEVERDRINSWVKDQTNGIIAELLVKGSVSANTRLLLVNAVYFKGAWLEPFSVARTTDQPFFRADGSQVKVPLMTRWDNARYTELRADGT